MLVAVILIYLVLVTSQPAGQVGLVGPWLGARLPHLTLLALTGNAEAVTLHELRGKVVLVNYWGTWCPPCVREFPEIEALGQRFAGRADFQLIPVSCGQGANDDLESLRLQTQQFLEVRNSHLATYADPGASSRQAMSVILDLQIAYPTTVLLDGQGRIRGLWLGYDPRAVKEMEAGIEKLLGE
jgi:thiol-disulfide isomerase/thioredoxin